MSDRIVVVTGATGALGSLLVTRLSQAGFRVVAVDRATAEPRLRALVEALPRAQTAAFDLTSTAAWASARANWERSFGPASDAVLVAGGFQGGSRFFEEASQATWQSMFEANLETARVGLQALLPGMVAARSGNIVVIGSRAAVRPWESTQAAAYAASKAALLALVQAAAQEVLADGVRLNAVLPSVLDTESNRAAMPKADPTRWVSLESLCGVIEFLLSDSARDISGAALPVYGKVGV